MPSPQGFELYQSGCVSGSDYGAMGLHFVKFSLVDDVLDVTQPEIILAARLAWKETPMAR